MRHTCTRVPATTYLGGGHGTQVHPGVGFAQHVVAARSVGEDLHPVQAHVHVRAAGVKEKRLVSPARPPSPAAPGVSSLPPAETPRWLQIPSPLGPRKDGDQRVQRAGLTCGASRAPHRPHSRCRCPTWRGQRPQRAQFPRRETRAHEVPAVPSGPHAEPGLQRPHTGLAGRPPFCFKP